ncbi:CPBP family intramembrane metalloprotease, partial [bacterium]
MNAPRLHPLVRLFYCGVGLIGVELLFASIPALGNVLATIWLGHPPTEPIGAIAERYGLLLAFISFLPALIWVAYCRTRLDQHSLASLGLRGNKAVSNALRGGATGILAVGLLWSVLWLCGAIRVEGWSREIALNGLSQAAPALIGYALLFGLVALCEELVLRGYALHNLNEWLGWKSAVAAQAGLFALLHLPNASGGTEEDLFAAIGAVPSLILIGVFFALCYRKTGSLWFPIGFHFTWNFCLGPLLSLAVSGTQTFQMLSVSTRGPLWLTGGSWGAEGSFLLIPILGALNYFISKAPDHPQAVLDLELSAHEVNFRVAPTPVLEIETEEEARANRFRTKFGSSQGFSPDTLRELRDLQEEREKTERETRAALEREQVASSS